MADEHATLTSPGSTETQSSCGARSPENGVPERLPTRSQPRQRLSQT